ncbi:hypothetical protein AB0J43_16710 [Nonomuraea fuscirosea]
MPIDKRSKIGKTVRSKPVRSIGTITTYSRGAAKCAYLSINRTWKRIPEITQLTLYLSSDSDWKKVTAHPKDWNRSRSPSLGPVKMTVKGDCATVIADVWLDMSATTGTRYSPRKIISDCF